MRRSSGLAILVLLAAAWLAGCDQPRGEYLPASSISGKGFVRDHQSISELQGGPVRLWGFVDHGNLYGDGRAKRVLAEWWSGEGPDADTWRFDLKAEADDPVGRSFAVLVPNDAGREELLERFVADARARSTTKVFVTGRLFTFHAPTQTLDLTGLYLKLSSSLDIRLDPPDGD